MAKGQMRVPKEKKKPKADKDKPKQMSAYKLSQMQGTSGQGCSTLFTESHGKDGFETAERCGVAVLGDRIGLVDPQDIVGEAAHSREDAGIFSDARRVFT